MKITLVELKKIINDVISEARVPELPWDAEHDCPDFTDPIVKNDPRYEAYGICSDISKEVNGFRLRFPWWEYTLEDINAKIDRLQTESDEMFTDTHEVDDENEWQGPKQSFDVTSQSDPDAEWDAMMDLPSAEPIRRPSREKLRRH